jgi:nitrogenase molybdenum-iron protein NifN
LLLANSHAVSIANQLGVQLLRVGYPQHDLIGCHAKTWIGYAGSRQSLFDIANLLLQARGDKQPYTSIYRQTDDNAAAPSGAARRCTKERTAA